MADLLTIADLASRSRFKRFLYHPFRYLFGVIYTHIFFPIFKKGVQKECYTFFHKKMQVLLPAGLDIYLLGAKTHDSEIRLAKFLQSNLEEGAVFFDIGAHFGYYSLLASSLVGENGQVISLEASSEIFGVLQKNIADEKNCKAFHLACGNTDGEIEFSEYPLLYSEYNTLYPQQFEQSKWVKKYKPTHKVVTMKMLDTIYNELAKVPNMIKIDTEGAEYDIINGASKLLAQVKPTIIMEYLHHDHRNEVYEQAAKKLIQLGYECHCILENGSLQKIEISALSNYFQVGNMTSDNLVFK